MRKYTAKKYISYVENTDDTVLQKWMTAEKDSIKRIRDSENKTFIDLGAGYGRLLAEIVAGDMTKLSKLLENENIQNPVFCIFQNTLGTVEGDWKEVLSQMKDRQGELLISLFRAEALKDYGIQMYIKLKDMVGEPDLQRTDFKHGLFMSKTGYTSKWWSTGEIEELKQFLGGKVIKEVTKPEYCIMHIQV